MELFCFLAIFVPIMKKILFFSLGFATLLLSCGPAAEDRNTMHARAKIIGDSIANILKTSMEEAAKPGPAFKPVVVDTGKKSAPDTSKKSK
ncbi:MAG: hypothetical protein K0S12_1742 [Bacteroidetes bacterium]|jgi:hypothetical protein|nr:hypothetical protein [Bacteroidota bacterium]